MPVPLLLPWHDRFGKKKSISCFPSCTFLACRCFPHRNVGVALSYFCRLSLFTIVVVFLAGIKYTLLKLLSYARTLKKYFDQCSSAMFPILQKEFHAIYFWQCRITAVHSLTYFRICLRGISRCTLWFPGRISLLLFLVRWGQKASALVVEKKGKAES